MIFSEKPVSTFRDHALGFGIVAGHGATEPATQVPAGGSTRMGMRDE
jgi:hypothetical protein